MRHSYIKVQTEPHHTNGKGIHHDLPFINGAPHRSPSLPRMAVNVARAAGTVVYERLKNGVPFFVPDNIFNDRMAICKTCPAFNIPKNVCTKCGCGAGRKLRLSAMTCPWTQDGKAAPKWGMWHG